MKMIVSPLLLSLVAFSGFREAPRPESERVDTNHSTCGFVVPIMGGLSRVTGKFSTFQVDLEFDPADAENSTVSVTIDAASLDTGIDDRDEHMRSADFFDVENHPTIEFVSKSVVEDGDHLSVTGDLTLRGVTKELVLEVDIHNTGDFESQMFGFTATTTLDRSEFGVAYQHRDIPDFIGNEIEVLIYTYARLR